jgi:hypothetical protein
LRADGPEPVLTSIVIVVFSQLYPTKRKKVKADSEEEEEEGDQQQVSFSLLLSFNIIIPGTYRRALRIQYNLIAEL